VALSRFGIQSISIIATNLALVESVGSGGKVRNNKIHESAGFW